MKIKILKLIFSLLLYVICFSNCYGAIDLFDFRMGVGEIFYTGNFHDYLPLNTAGVELGLDLYTKKYLIDLGYGGNFSPYRLKQPFVFWDTGTSISITNYFIKLGYLVNREELSENKLNCYPYAGISKNILMSDDGYSIASVQTNSFTYGISLIWVKRHTKIDISISQPEFTNIFNGTRYSIMLSYLIFSTDMYGTN